MVKHTQTIRRLLPVGCFTNFLYVFLQETWRQSIVQASQSVTWQTIHYVPGCQLIDNALCVTHVMTVSNHPPVNPLPLFLTRFFSTCLYKANFENFHPTLRIQWRLIFAIVIRCYRLRLWVGFFFNYICVLLIDAL